MIATQPLPAADAWTRSARAALASYDAALDAVHRAVLRVSARPVQPEQHLPESMARALMEKAEVIQAGMQAARADVVGMHARALPLSVMATLMCTGVVRVVRLRINLGGEDLPVWETITVTAPQGVQGSYIVSCTSERTPEFWADQTAGSCDDPLGMYMPRCVRHPIPLLLLTQHAATSGGSKRPGEQSERQRARRAVCTHTPARLTVKASRSCLRRWREAASSRRRCAAPPAGRPCSPRTAPGTVLCASTGVNDVLLYACVRLRPQRRCAQCGTRGAAPPRDKQRRSLPFVTSDPPICALSHVVIKDS